MKILIAGVGKVGMAIARELAAEGNDITLIDTNLRVLESVVERYDVMTFHGNCASMAALMDAGTKDAELLIAATGKDEVNLLCCVMAHGINPNLHTIARIRNPEYTDQIYMLRDTFALSLAVNPELQTATEIERLLKFPGFLKRDTFAKGRVQIVELRVERGSKLCDLPLSGMNNAVGCKVLVCAVLRGGTAVTPSGNFVLREGDRIFVTAPTNDLALLLRNLGIITRRVRRVLICGGGRVSFYLAQLLCKSGMTVQLVEKDPDRCAELAGLLPSVSVILGDGTNQFLLDSEGIADCDALVTTTGLDEQNMIISLYGRNRGVPQVVTKLSRSENSRLAENLSLGSIVCPKDLCSDTIVRYVRAMKNQTGAALSVHSIADGQAEAMEFLVDDTTLHCGEPLRKLRLRPNVLVVSITHENTIEIPNGDSCFNAGDTLVLVTSDDNIITQLNDIFED